MMSFSRQLSLQSAAEIKLTQWVPPMFLVPAFEHQKTVRHLSTSRPCSSHIGRAPLTIPPEVNIRVTPPEFVRQLRWPPRHDGQMLVEVSGPLGTLSVDLPAYMTLDYDETGRKAEVKIQDKNVRNQREMWGTTRAYLSNHILGVSEGHTAILKLVGVGYRATIEDTASTVASAYPGQKFVSLKVGYSHPVELGVPLGIKASTPQPTRILLEGIEKEAVNEFAAKIRQWRRPEPYKGKGIFVNGETIRLKAKKIK